MSGDRPWQGRATLTYRRQGDKTVPLVQTQAPLKVQRPFYPEANHCCHTILLHTAGGMVGGDRLAYDLTLEPQTQALITTAAAAKIYNDHPHQRPAQVTGVVRVGEGALLEWLPQESILFEGARYHQTWRVDLAPQAHWLGWDILRLGRTARGERFVQGEVRSRFEIWQGDTPLWIDPQGFMANETRWHSPHALASCPIVATLVWVGSPVDRSLVDRLRDLWQTTSQNRGEAGVSRLQAGLICRYRGHSTSEVRRWFEAVWGQIRHTHSSQKPLSPRVWQR